MRALLEGLKDQKADGLINGSRDGSITVSELNKYLATRVAELTENLQQPTSRALNYSNDFQIW